MYVVVGLGNPGTRYRNTYHNIGFMTADALAKKCKLRMNLSGESVKQLVRKYCDSAEELIVVYDDADLPVGRMRFREEGSAGTHNGMRSIVSELNDTSFKRLRIGIKTEELAQKEVDIVDLVLSKVDYADKPAIERCIDEGADAILRLIAGEDIQRIEERLNRRK